MQDAQVLRRILILQLGRKPNKAEIGEDLNPPNISVSSGRGRSLYTDRTRTNRALLLIPTVLALTGLVPLIRSFVFASDPPVPTDSWVFMGCFAGSLWLGAFYAWARYRRYRIEIDQEGITECGLFRSKHLRWDEVTSYALREDGFMGQGLVKGETSQVRFSLTIAHLDQLKSEIVQRAVRSENREWKDPRAVD